MSLVALLAFARVSRARKQRARQRQLAFIEKHSDTFLRKVLLPQVKIGRGNSWAPKTSLRKNFEAHQVFEKMTFERNDLWASYFGGFSPTDIWNISRRLPFQDKAPHKLSQLNRTALFIYRMKTSATFRETGVTFGISHGKATDIFHQVLHLLLLVFRDIVSLPSPAEALRTKQWLSNINAFVPGTIFIVDCTHTPMPYDEGRSSMLHYSWKLKRNAMSSLFMICRKTGLIRYASIGHPASYNDMEIMQTCNLFHDPVKRNIFFRDYGPLPMLGDQGFFSAEFPGIITPIATTFSTSSIQRWQTLNQEERNWSSNICREEVKIENTFAQLFVRKWKLLNRGPDPLCKDPLHVQPRIMMAGTILYNLEIILTGRSFLDGPRIFFSLND